MYPAELSFGEIWTGYVFKVQYRCRSFPVCDNEIENYYAEKIR